MGHLPILKPQELARILQNHGFVFVRQAGSHAIFCHPDGRQTVVPMHRKTLGKGLLHRIYKQAKLSSNGHS
jgi:predicted RNA binding protein YcfA (HicA-like mRNA interferase family)